MPTDAKQQTTTYGYDLADALTPITFTNAEHPTPNVNFSYDAAYGRQATMVDGTGTTPYTYHAVTDPPSLGAGQLASVNGPVTDDTITYTHDELGRVVTRSINGAANTVVWAYDALRRKTSEQNVLGTFTCTYDGTTGRVATVAYPNGPAFAKATAGLAAARVGDLAASGGGQTSTYSYYGNTGDRRLQTIHHKYRNSSTLSKLDPSTPFGVALSLSKGDYTYDAVANILASFRARGAPPPARLAPRLRSSRGPQALRPWRHRLEG